MTPIPSLIHRCEEILTQHGVVADDPLPTLVWATLRTSGETIPHAPEKIRFGGLLSHEACVRCRQGRDTIYPHDPRDRVVYWWLPTEQVAINIHLQCLTPTELAWAWTQL